MLATVLRHSVPAIQPPAARRRKADDSTSYLVELEIGGEVVGTMQLRLDEHGRLCNAFSVDDDIDGLSRLLTSLERDRRPSVGTYRRILPRTAVRELRRGRAHFDDSPTSEQEGNPWPRNRALVDFILDRFDTSGG